MIAAIIHLVLLGLFIWIPGGLALRLIYKRAQSLEGLQWLFLGTAFGLVLNGVWGILLASIGQFRPLWFGAGWLLCSVLLWFLGGRFEPIVKLPAFSAWDWLALELLILMALVFAGPHENFIVGRDPGVYTNTAIHLARSGEWAIKDAFFADLPTETQEAFLSYVWRQGPFRLPGFFWEPEKGRALSQFLPFYTVWMALLEWVLGPGAGLWASLLFTLTAASGLAWLASWFWQSRTMFFFLLLFLCNPAVIWYARSANAEVALLTLLVLFAVLWIEAREQPGSKILPSFIVLTLIAAFLAKLDMLYFAVAIGIVGLFESQVRLWRLVIPAVCALVVASIFMYLFNFPYLELSFNLMSRYVFSALLIGGMLALGVGVIFLVFVVTQSGRMFHRKVREWISRFSGLTQKQICIGLVSWAVVVAVLYYVLPAMVPAELIADRRLNFLKFGWYLTPIGLILMGSGAISLFYKRPKPGAILFLGFWGISLLPNLLVGMPDQIFGIRRFVAFALPGGVVLIAGCLDSLVNWRPHRIPYAGWGLAALLSVTLMSGQVARSAIVVLTRQYEGARETLQTVGERLPAEAIVLFPDTHTFLGTFMGPNFWLGYDLNVLHASRPLALDDWLTVYKVGQSASQEVFALGAVPPPILSDVDCIALQRFSWRLPELERTYEHFPNRIDSFDLDFVVWQLVSGVGGRVYQPESLLTQVGRVASVNNASVLQGQGASGYLSYGPYETFVPGTYSVYFELINTEQVTRRVVLDVTPFGHSPLAYLESDLAVVETVQDIALSFVITEQVLAETPLEFRVFLPNGGYVGLARMTVIPVTD